MFNSLAGRITGHDFPLLYLATGGIEWELEVSATTFQAALGADKTVRQRFMIHLHTREDILKLYGFRTIAERTAFRELLKVTGIGPKQALRILSGTTVPALTELLEQEDVDALTRIPGLGRKTAQKMILQLKGHLALDPEQTHSGGSASGAPGDELVAALVDMGFDRSAARDALQRISTELAGDEGAGDGAGDAPDEQELFRRAIVALSGS
ncbi:MAG: Holliday junction branch migration protein RuvA [Alkalispirochaeta sp.]